MADWLAESAPTMAAGYLPPDAAEKSIAFAAHEAVRRCFVQPIFFCPHSSPERFQMNQSFPRRVFLMTLAVSGAALATRALAQALVDEKSPQATALGYVAEAKRVDVKKYPKFAAGQNCANCALYQGKAADQAGGCPLFAGKQVAAAGWCSAWAKKA